MHLYLYSYSNQEGLIRLFAELISDNTKIKFARIILSVSIDQKISYLHFHKIVDIQ